MPKLPPRKNTLAGKLKKISEKPKVIWTLRPEVLLCSRVPKQMHGMAPRVVLGVNWWNSTRLMAYKSTDFHCVACGVHKSCAKYHQWLEAHEIYDIDYLLGTMTYVEAVPLCHFCHNYIHDGRLKALLDIGKIHHAKYAAIIQHGDDVLRRSGLTKSPPDTFQDCADWDEWRLVIDGVEYAGLHKSAEDWMTYHERKNQDD